MMDGFDRFCIIFMFLSVLALSLISVFLTNDVQDRIKVLEHIAVEAKP